MLLKISLTIYQPACTSEIQAHYSLAASEVTNF